MNLKRIEGSETLLKFIKKDADFLSKIYDVHIQDTDIIDFIDNSLQVILRNKGISKEGCAQFYEKISNVYPKADELINFIELVENPPFDIYDHLNQIKRIKDICCASNFENYSWLTTYKFPGGANVGSFEAFMITMFKNMSNPSKGGDIEYKSGEFIEVKGSSGRLMGQHGYKNGLIQYLDELLSIMGISIPSNKLSYNFNSNTITILNQKIKTLRNELKFEKLKYNEQLLGKEKRMNESASNKKSKKYLECKKQYLTYKKTIPKRISNIDEEILTCENQIKNSILENISIELAKKSLNDSIYFFVKIFSRKYNNADDSKIESFIKRSLNLDGSFNDMFFKEYLIFEFEYYQYLENFKYFCLVNLKEDLMLIIDSQEKFREFVYSENIIIKSRPSVSEHSGQQGMVFSIDLSVKNMSV